MKGKSRKIAIAFSFFILLPALGMSQTTWYVDGANTSGPWDGSQVNPFQFIQDGIGAAVHKDTVLVMPYTYVENIDFSGKAITVTSEQGPEITIIDGDHAGTVAIFNSGENSESILEGFTITNGSGTTVGNPICGGGICCYGASPTIISNIIINNSVMSGGAWGGVSTFGGGIYCGDHSHPNILNNIVSENYSFCGGCFLDDGWGGGICCDSYSSPLISNNTITGNAAGYGGGIYCRDNANPLIANNIISGNDTENTGGGIECSHSSPTITNNTIIGNSACYIYGGGGIYFHNSTSIITNTILWNNYTQYGTEISIESSGSPSTLTISYSDVKGGQSSVHVSPASTLNWGPGIIDSDPLFVDDAKNDFHLTFNSPCRGSGDNCAITELNDFEGDPRIAYATVDMGADEFYTHLYYSGDATPGSSIALKFVELPGSSPVGFWIAFNAQDNPFPVACGDWYLLPPIVGPFLLSPIPSAGVLVLPGTLPAIPSGPYTLYLQAIMGTPLKLTNLCTMDVE